MITRAFTFAFIVFILYPNHGHANNQLKIGVFDLRRVVQSTLVGASAQAEIKAAVKRHQHRLLSKKKEIETLQDTVANQEKSPDAKAFLMNDGQLRELMAGFVASQKEKKTELNETILKINRGLFLKISAEAEKLGRNLGYHIVLERHKAGVIYAAEEIDLTDAIISAMNDITISY